MGNWSEKLDNVLEETHTELRKKNQDSWETATSMIVFRVLDTYSTKDVINAIKNFIIFKKNQGNEDILILKKIFELN